MQFGAKHQLFREKDRILAAVSGGVDSMVMAELLHSCGLLAGIAHVNYRLRGQNSDLDQSLVQSTAERIKIPCFIKCVDEDWREKYKGSLQMAARTFRYDWFESLFDSNGFTAVATAHHLNDQAETSVLNMIKGMSAPALTGIPFRNHHIIRPLMFLTREEILRYAVEQKIQWREDHSNSSDVYQRNMIRNRIMPLINEINPSFPHSADASKFKGEGMIELFQKGLKALKSEVISEHSNGVFEISLRVISSFRHPSSVLFHLIEEFGFTEDTSSRIFTDAQIGAQFLSQTHRLQLDRNRLLISEREKSKDVFSPVEITGSGLYQSGRLKIKLEHCTRSMDSEKSRHIIWADPEKLSFPLEWRTWQPGDRFIPVGMTGHKKVSDLLTDEKIPLSEKNEITVLLSRGQIVWVPGLRAAREFSLDPLQTEGFRLEYSNTGF